MLATHVPADMLFVFGGCSTVFVSYAMVTMNDATLYTNPAKVPADVADRFKVSAAAHSTSV